MFQASQNLAETLRFATQKWSSRDAAPRILESEIQQPSAVAVGNKKRNKSGGRDKRKKMEEADTGQEGRQSKKPREGGHFPQEGRHNRGKADTFRKH